jgi:alpha-beta hydrolase superfamily lysophospholipase
MFGSNKDSERYAGLMCAESFWAYLQLMMPIGRVQKKVPMLVMGGSADALISVDEFKATSKHYDAELMLFDGGSHDLMLEHDCRKYLDKIHGWLLG